ncbi:protein of unknown function [Haloechinothrix alba]|uniref:DUF397 domain-containing protein n=1 Tax=Haloechinothrix alba TaxID=664784 RepID=A0A238VUG6_9PSEU|nr:DUF397 domain-containing protein [Haloechinothrix alba]SNR37807.1 protein of unknown function [Haloechinothrix alba]
MTHSEWRTDSYSGGSGQCVEVSFGDTARVRDTKDRQGGVLDLSDAAWRAFTTALKVR